MPGYAKLSLQLRDALSERFGTGLRGGEVLHLDIAANHGTSKILTLDAGFIDAGKLLKLPVTRGIKG